MTEQTQEFYLGQVFDGIYPPEAAHWCNEGQMYHIDEIEPNAETGERRFQIVENEIYEPTEEELAEMQAQYEAWKRKNNMQLEFVRTLDLNDDNVEYLEDSLPYWDADTEYREGDYVILDGAIYRCTIPHNSNEATIAIADATMGGQLSYIDQHWVEIKDLSDGSVD